jgi:hypothetical protein
LVTLPCVVSSEPIIKPRRFQSACC